jgi:hypothetical protein
VARQGPVDVGRDDRPALDLIQLLRPLVGLLGGDPVVDEVVELVDRDVPVTVQVRGAVA